MALLAGSATAREFTASDLEKIVTELDKVIPENPDYKYPIKCSIVDKDEVNAYATLTKEGTAKRSTMVVFTGLVTKMDGDVRLIRAVVAHELSHLSLGHLSAIDPAARDLRNLWTRQQEYAADKSGAEALVKAGYSKKDMVDMLLFLDRNRGRAGGWLDRLTGDHADPKARAAEVSDNPAALNALLTFDTALAYEDAREHRYAQKLFDYAGSQWAALTEAYTNSAKCALLYYYDNLPKAVRTTWWRPDFGPLITNTHAPAVQAAEVTDDDRTAWKDAMTAIDKAVERNPGSEDAEELRALAQVLEPDAKKDVVQLGIDWFKGHADSASDPIL
ncbi:MAG TPA: M48 family metalloprotease, partial [Fimbriimonadaceae bacterium]|nr:M48 family metalloprotease [Fimbriimonadaceae bacterium]